MKDPFKIQEEGSDIKDQKIKGYTQREEEGSHFPQKETQESLGVFISSKKIKWLVTFIGLAFLILLSRLIYLQLIKGREYREIAEGNRIRIVREKARRGLIYDRDKTPLLKNKASFFLFFTPLDLPQNENLLDNLIQKLAEILEKDAQEIKAQILQSNRSSFEPQVLAENIERNKALLLKIKTKDMPGVFVEVRSKREYLAGPEFSHLIGYLGKITKKEWENLREDKDKDYEISDQIGKSGLESFYEKILRGKDGKKEIEIDALGKEKKVIAEEEAINGKSLILSIDSKLEKKLAESLKEGILRAKASKGAAVALDPRNGEVLALISLPSYDNNLFSEGIQEEDYQNLITDPSKPLFPRSFQGEYPSGSTIKPVISAAALQEKIITPRTSILSTGGLKFSKWFFPDWKEGGHGLTNIYKALAESVNTFFYYIGGGYEEFPGLGIEKMVLYAKKFGLGKKLGIDLSDEASGFLPSKAWKEEVKKEKWYIGDTYHFAIGQGDLLVSPLQVASFTSVFASEGKLYKPHLVKEIIDVENKLVKEIKPEILNSNFINPEYINIVRQGLREAVVYGSAQALAQLSIKVAGKTGTAQVGGGKEPHAWFTGWAPYENPEIVLTVLIENGGEGSTAALPIFKEVISWYFSR